MLEKAGSSLEAQSFRVMVQQELVRQTYLAKLALVLIDPDPLNDFGVNGGAIITNVKLKQINLDKFDKIKNLYCLLKY